MYYCPIHNTAQVRRVIKSKNTLFIIIKSNMQIVSWILTIISGMVKISSVLEAGSAPVVRHKRKDPN
jgi:hypothetical protein